MKQSSYSHRLFVPLLMLTLLSTEGFSRRLSFVSASMRDAEQSASQKPVYHFESAKFTKEFWIDNKRVFTQPKSVNVEFATAGPFYWVLADADGKEVKTIRHSNEHGNWTGIDFASLGLFGDYRIGFRNDSSTEQEIKQGDVEFR